MDPNVALQNILTDFDANEAITALQDWLRSGGFKPDIPVPEAALSHALFEDHARDAVGVTADLAGIRFTYAVANPRVVSDLVPWARVEVHEAMEQAVLAFCDAADGLVETMNDLAAPPSDTQVTQILAALSEVHRKL
jgi:hypothetical protein